MLPAHSPRWVPRYGGTSRRLQSRILTRCSRSMSAPYFLVRQLMPILRVSSVVFISSLAAFAAVRSLSAKRQPRERSTPWTSTSATDPASSTSSAVTAITPPQTAVYTASKGALDVITGVPAKELGPRKIRVNSVNPSLTEPQGTHTAGMIASEFEAGIIAQSYLSIWSASGHRRRRGFRRRALAHRRENFGRRRSPLSWRISPSQASAHSLENDSC
jgi:NAD(P)-dependent dehydrogenase (short-subunit alcohol dehydrogenase family)